MDSAVYELIIRAMELDRSIDQVMGMLPRRAISQYMDRCLIDEIVLTNGIEGVHSTRREIDDALEMLAEKDEPVGFWASSRNTMRLKHANRFPSKRALMYAPPITNWFWMRSWRTIRAMLPMGNSFAQDL